MQPAVDVFSNKIELIAPDAFIPSNNFPPLILQHLSDEILPERAELSCSQFFEVLCHTPRSPWFPIEFFFGYLLPRLLPPWRFGNTLAQRA